MNPVEDGQASQPRRTSGHQAHWVIGTPEPTPPHATPTPLRPRRRFRPRRRDRRRARHDPVAPVGDARDGGDGRDGGRADHADRARARADTSAAARRRTSTSAAGRCSAAGPSATSPVRAIDLGIPGKKLWARGLKAYVEYPPSYCDGDALREHLQGGHLGDRRGDGEGRMAEGHGRPQAVDPGDRRRQPDRQLKGRDRHRADATERQGGLAAPHQRDRRVVACRRGRRSRTSARRTAGSSRSTPTRATCAGRTTRAGGSTRARRSPRAASASRRMRARSSACASGTARSSGART